MVITHKEIRLKGKPTIEEIKKVFNDVFDDINVVCSFNVYPDEIRYELTVKQ
jgi:hypothetical protein